MDSTKNTKQKLNLVFIPLPGIGHLISMVEFIKKILLYNQFTAMVIPIPTREPSPQVSAYISSVEADPDLDITFHHLPNISHHPTSLIDPLKVMPNVKAAIPTSMPIAAIIADMFFTDMVDVTHELGIPFYIFFSSTASFLGFLLYLPTIDAKLPDGKNIDELGEEEEDGLLPISLPGFTSALPEIAIPQCCFRRNAHMYALMLHSSHRYREAQGIVINTSTELEPNVIKALEEGKYLKNHPTPPVYPVGPLLSINLDPSPPDKEQHECIQWLNLQPPRSVVFLCFGSKDTFPTDQAREIAVGLEKTGYRFLWVLRIIPPQSKSPLATDAVLDEVLPSGFLERTKERGMVWPKFAPQTDILGHEAIGGFVTHCGWNSIVESLWFGVPMLAWPLSAEQHLNAFEIVTEMETAIGLKVDRKGQNWVDTKELERGVRCLMGEECCDKSKKVRSTTAEMSKKMKKTMEEGGSSVVYMEKLTQALTSDIKSWIKSSKKYTQGVGLE